MLRELLIVIGIVIELFTFYLIVSNIDNGICTDSLFCLWAFNFLLMILIGVIFIAIGLSLIVIGLSEDLK